MSSVACVNCFGTWMVEHVKNAKKDMCIHGIKQWLFCRKCENWLQNIKKFCEKNHPLNINYQGKEKEYMPITTCDTCGGESFVSDEETPTCIGCSGNTCRECGECDCECECCEKHHEVDCKKCNLENE